MDRRCFAGSSDTGRTGHSQRYEPRQGLASLPEPEPKPEPEPEPEPELERGEPSRQRCWQSGAFTGAAFPLPFGGMGWGPAGHWSAVRMIGSRLLPGAAAAHPSYYCQTDGVNNKNELDPELQMAPAVAALLAGIAPVAARLGRRGGLLGRPVTRARRPGRPVSRAALCPRPSRVNYRVHHTARAAAPGGEGRGRARVTFVATCHICNGVSHL